MGACIWKRVVYDMSCKRFQFFVNVEALFTMVKLLGIFCKSVILIFGGITSLNYKTWIFLF